MEIRSENNKEDNEIINPLRNIANKLADKKNKNNPYNIYIRVECLTHCISSFNFHFVLPHTISKFH